MILHEVIQALKEHCPEFDGFVSGAADWSRLDLLRNEAPAYPCAYVVPLADRAETNDSVVDYRQSVTETFAVIVVLNLDDSQGVDAVTRIKHTIQPSIFKAILSWSPNSALYSEIQFSGAEVIYMDTARICYQFEFSFDYFLDVGDTRQGKDLAMLQAIRSVDVDVGIHPDLVPELKGKVSIKMED